MPVAIATMTERRLPLRFLNIQTEVNSMAGQAKKLLDALMASRCKGNKALEQTTKVKLILRGLDPDKFSASSPDDPSVIDKIRQTASEMGISL
jgi:hypothetical protein